VNRKRYQRKRKKEEEAPTDRAARLTATATIWMAIFTLLLILVGGGTYWILKNQLREMHEGGIDTQNLARAAQKQAAASVQQVSNFAALAIAAKTQSDNTVALAQAAKDQVTKMEALGAATIAQNQVLANQLTTMQNGQIVQERPWIKVGHGISAPLTFDVEGRIGSPMATMTIQDTIENVGQTGTCCPGRTLFQ
jgi:hypothetical protein